MRIDAKSVIAIGSAAAVILMTLLFAFSAWTQPSMRHGLEPDVPGSGPGNAKATPGESITLNAAQTGAFKIAAVQEVDFSNRLEAVGNVEFNQDRTVQVYSAYQGKVRNVYVQVGDDIKRGDALYDIDSPDLVQAELTLISTAGTRRLTANALERARRLFEVQGIAQKDVDQAVSDQQAAEAAYQAARDAMAIFGKTNADMDRVIAQRRTDAALTVRSPLTGRVTARNAQSGLLVQPGSGAAPVTISDLSTVWMQAFVPESDTPLLRVGQTVTVRATALPGREFTGTITTLNANIDSVTHRMQVRAEVRDSEHVLRPGMITSCDIRTAPPSRSPAVAANGIVREGDGTMTVWVTQDKRRFERRVVTLGLAQGELVQVLSGLAPGELVISDGAVFLSNAATMATP